MTIMEFFGCAFLAYGPAIAMFIFTIMSDPLRVIVSMASAFFWLLGLLLSSILWFAVVPLREQLAFGLVFSVLFQEGFRILFYFLLRKAEVGLKKVIEREGATGVTLANNKHLLGYVAGFGFGIVSGAFSLVNVLADMTGPGTMGIKGDSDMFFITSALLTQCFIFLHTFWSVICYAGLDQKRYHYVVIVVLSHMLVSCMTLLNEGTSPIYAATVVTPYVVMVGLGIFAFFISGGSFRNIKMCVSGSRGGYQM